MTIQVLAQEKKSIFVVLGLNKSGMSVITHGLSVLGIHDSPQTLYGKKNDDEVDFDLAFETINSELVSSVGKDWHTLKRIETEELFNEENELLFFDAIKLLESRLKNEDSFVLSDIRLSYFLPFWQKVFAELGVNVSYIIVVRNPLSIAASLKKEYSISPEKSFYLWLKTVFSSLQYTKQSSRVLVDYDLLLDYPEKQIVNLAQAFNLEAKFDKEKLDLYIEKVLDKELRHTKFNIEDVLKDSSTPLLIKKLYPLLHDIAHNEINFDDQVINESLETIEQEIQQLNPLLSYLSQLDHHIESLSRNIAAKDQQLHTLVESNAHKDMAIHQLRISAIQHGFRLKQVYSLWIWKLLIPFRLTKRWLSNTIKVEAFPLEQLQQNNNQWTSLGHTPQFLLVAERAWHGLSGWHWLNIEVYAEQALKAQIFFDIDGTGFSLAINVLLLGKGFQQIPVYIPSTCHAIRFDPCDVPTSFKLTQISLQTLKQAPQLPSEFEKTLVYEALGYTEGNVNILKPGNSVLRNNGGDDYCWRSTDEDPSFLLDTKTSRLAQGWYMIELIIRSDIGRGNARIYFDYGAGYNQADSIELPFNSNKVSKRLYYLKAVPRQIRFDPVECVAKFSIVRTHFQPMLTMLAYQRMLKRLSNHYASFKDKSLIDIWKELSKQAQLEKSETKNLLTEYYGETFKESSSISYAEWIERFETPLLSGLNVEQKIQNSLSYHPLISIIMPVYNTEKTFLKLAIDSVLTQSYTNWELCICDDASPQKHVKKVLEEYMQQDERIKVVFRQENGHISVASNSALEIATGDYVALLDHDDELAPHALYFMLEAINQNPNAKVFYSDEDKIDAVGKRSHPHFKSDWNPDLFFSQNYISHLGVYQHKLLQKIGGFREGVEGSQDQDLLLRCLPYVKSNEIVHIPKVLYHWRMLEGSTASSAGEKGYTTDAGIKALQDFFDSQGQKDIKVEAGCSANLYRIHYPIPTPEPLVSLLIPTRDMLEVLEPCIQSVLDKTTYQNYEIIILDNESVKPETLKYFKDIQEEDKRVSVLPYHKPFNYSAINNYGVAHAKGELIGLINNDIEVISPEWLTEMVSHAIRPEIGCVGAKLYYDDKTIQHAGVILGLGGVAGHSHKHYPRHAPGYFYRLQVVQNLSAVTAACLIVRKGIFEEVKGLEEEGLQVAFNDVDFCIKVREAGYRNLWTPYAELYHHESKSRGMEDTPEKRTRFNQEIAFISSKWGEKLKKDPYYNPNLTLAREDFSLKL